MAMRFLHHWILWGATAGSVDNNEEATLRFLNPPDELLTNDFGSIPEARFPVPILSVV
jgi:hypothetical protein